MSCYTRFTINCGWFCFIFTPQKLFKKTKHKLQNKISWAYHFNWNWNFFFASWTFFLPVKVFLKTKKIPLKQWQWKCIRQMSFRYLKESRFFFFLLKKFNTEEVRLVISRLTRWLPWQFSENLPKKDVRVRVRVYTWGIEVTVV